MQSFDLHMHTNASDGSLPVAELIARAESNGVSLISITDHDHFVAYEQLAKLHRSSLEIIKGIEFSTLWSGVGIHILGYGCNAQHPSIKDLVAYQTQARWQRAELIAQKLEKRGACDVVTWLYGHSQQHYIGRPHFAQYLVDTGKTTSIQQAFKKYLGAGKVGDIKSNWATLEQVTTAICESGGMALLAHPAKYKMTNAKLKRLLIDFKALGGVGMEVVSGQQTNDVTQYLAELCNHHEFVASAGSDFHHPGRPWNEVGAQSPLPSHCDSILNYVTELQCNLHD